MKVFYLLFFLLTVNIYCSAQDSTVVISEIAIKLEANDFHLDIPFHSLEISCWYPDQGEFGGHYEKIILNKKLIIQNLITLIFVMDINIMEKFFANSVKMDIF